MTKACFQLGLGICPFLLLILFIIPSCTYDSLEFEPDCSGVIVLELIEVQASLCNQNTGSIKVGVSNNADPNLNFSIDGTNFQADGSFNGLAAGSYTITAASNGCEENLTVQVENAEGLNASISNITPSDCEGSTGTIELNVTDASGAVEYQINGSTPQSSNTFSNLAPGTYNLTVSDEAGCDFRLEATVSSTVEFANIELIINNSCAISGCHAGNVSPDFRVKNNILNNANKIKARTTAQSMPPSSSGISLTPEEIESISCWVNDGAQG